MLRILRAFAWMRWRMLINSFEKTGSRDILERFSIAAQKLGPLIAAVLIIPTALFLAVGSTAAGYGVAQGNQYSLAFVALRYVLLFVPIAAVLGPLFLPSGDRTNPVRLLLLPIPQSTLYLAQTATAIGEPWIVLMLPILLGIPLGLLAGGAIGAFAFAAVAGVLLLIVTVGIAALATTVLHLVVRDRRRAEFLGVVFIIVISMAGLIPSMMQGPRRTSADGRRTHREVTVPAWVESAAARTFRFYPTELYVRGIRSSAAGGLAPAARAAIALGATAVMIHALGLMAFSFVLAGPTTSGTRRGKADAGTWGRTLPLLSPGVSAVVLSHLRLAMRTTRGRTSLISPLIILVTFSALALREHGAMEFGAFNVQGGQGLATFVSFVTLIAMLPITMNQFAVDGPGLTMVLLSPLSEREYLAGKAIGNALLSLPSAYLCVFAVFLMFPAGTPALWFSIPIGLTATYMIVAPAAAAFSAIFPKQADLSSIGGRGNAHGLSGLLGLASFVAGAAPCVGIVLLCTLLLKRPWLAPLLLLGWCAVAFGISRLLFVIARRIFDSRRENLAMLVSRLLSPS